MSGPFLCHLPSSPPSMLRPAGVSPVRHFACLLLDDAQRSSSASYFSASIAAICWAVYLPVSGRIGWFAGILNFSKVAPSIGLRSVQISEAIDLCKLATRQRLTTPARHLGICCEGGDGTPDVPRRFGDDE